MGAVAITTLGGNILIENAHRSIFLQSILPFIKGFTLFFWATATWWIPMLIILGVWRYIFKKFRLTYVPQHWDAVFPLGMYAVSTFLLAKVLHLDFLTSIADYFIYIAIFVWTATFFGFLHMLSKKIFI
jgi:tellurite resistance protein TehA-like permease